MKIVKEEIKLSLFTVDMIFYVENYKDVTNTETNKQLRKVCKIQG